MKSLSQADTGAPLLTGGPLRVGVLGCSDIARRKFIPALRNCSSAVLAAVAGRNQEKAAGYAGEHNCRVKTASELLSAPDIDLVYISLPNHLHEEWSIRALESGKHVICEKPLSTSAASVEKMLSAAERSGRLLYENLMFLHHPQHAVVKELLDSGRIGRIVALRSCFGFPFPKNSDFRLDPLQGGGAFHDLARYPLGTARYFLETPPKRFRGHALYRDGLNTALQGTAVTRGEELFSFSMVFGQQYESYYEIVGETGKIRLDRAYTTPADFANRIELLQGGECCEISVPPADHFQKMIEHVCAVVRQGNDYRELHERTGQLARLADEMERGCFDDKY
jgi:predicted dehydrogenase